MKSKIHKQQQKNKITFCKKILITLSFFIATSTNLLAQDMQVIDSPPNWPLMLSNLNTTQITSGILYNKVAMFTNLYDYNRGKYNLSHADHFMQGINELHYASDQLKFISAKQLKANLAGTSGTQMLSATSATVAAPIAPSVTATVNIGIINTTIHQLNFNELDPTTGGLTFLNEKFVPIAGRPAFLSRKILLASPLQETATGTSVKYSFSNARIYNNATTVIKKLVVYFDNTTPVTIINNNLLVLANKTISYSTSGSKMIKFIATFSDNTTITTVGYHYFNYKSATATALTTTNTSSPCYEILKERGTYKSTIGFQGYDEPAEYFGKFDYTTFYHIKNPNGSVNSSERKLLKPIIIIDGFDPGDKRKTTDCDCEQDKSEDGCFLKYSTRQSFLSTLITGVEYVFNPDKHESIYDLMTYKDIVNGETIDKNLVIKLREEGYDVIILNIPKYYTSALGGTVEDKSIDGGADYVERNGRALASYIKSTKDSLSQNGSLENLVIMGPSMGGLISRYALAYMEKKEFEATTPSEKASWKHNTRIWVSFDSPHLGANVPMGAQANIWFFGEKLRNSSAEEKFNKELNSTTGKQMLIDQFQHTLNTMSNGTGYSNNSPFYVQFQNNLNANGVAGSSGFPVSNANFRKIAIVNGSLSGTKNGVESGEFLNVRGYKDPTWTEGLVGGAVLGSVIPFAGTITGAIFGTLLGASNANVTLLRCRDKFYPGTGQTDDIFNGDGQNFKIGWNQWYINHKWYNLKATNNSIKGSLDVFPAGTFTTNKILREEIIKGLDDAGLSHEIRGTNIDTHSFIPTFSALAHLQPYQSWSNPLNTNLACSTNKLTPFDSYFGATSNTPHITLTKEMVDWLMKEIGDSTNPPTPQAPSFPIDQNALQGPAIICINSNEIFSFTDTCKVPSAVISWSVTPNVQIVSSNDYSVFIKGVNNGTAIITATFTNGVKINKSIWVGIPELPDTNFVTGATSVNFNQIRTYTYTGTPIGATNNYNWYINAPFNDNGGPTCAWEILSGQGTQNITVKTGCITGGATVVVTTSNICGSDYKYLYVNNLPNGSGGDPCDPLLLTYPNPISTSSNLEVSLVAPDPCDGEIPNPDARMAQTSQENQVKIYDLFGVMVYSENFSENTMTLNNINLSSGHYILNVFAKNGKVLRKVIIVQ